MPKQKVQIKINDLPKGSNRYIPIICDFCGKEFERQYGSYLRGHKDVNCDACNDPKCQAKKKYEINIKKYGTNNYKEISDIAGFQLGRKTKYSKDDIYKMASIKGYTILDDLPEHIITHNELNMLCNKHNIKFQTNVYGLMDEESNNCPECRNEHLSEVQRKCSIDDARAIADERDYTLLTDFIANCDDKIEYICNKHPDYGIQNTSLWGLQHYQNNCRLCRMPRGEDHYNWQGGIADDRERDNDSFEYKRWRKSVFKRDNYTCMCCGKRSGKLNAHHINNYSSNPELRYKKENGITLCEECHLNNFPTSFHKIYGNYNNTKEQLQEYLDNRRSELEFPQINIDTIINKQIDD